MNATPVLGQVIAVRQYTATGIGANGNTAQATVELKLGLPLAYSDPSKGYFCPFQLTGSGNDAICLGRGIDSVDALVSAMENAKMMLECWPAYASLDLVVGVGDVRLPVLPELLSEGEIQDLIDEFEGGNAPGCTACESGLR